LIDWIAEAENSVTVRRKRRRRRRRRTRRFVVPRPDATGSHLIQNVLRKFILTTFIVNKYTIFIFLLKS
jgi:hypothetical protein